MHRTIWLSFLSTESDVPWRLRCTNFVSTVAEPCLRWGASDARPDSLVWGRRSMPHSKNSTPRRFVAVAPFTQVLYPALRLYWQSACREWFYMFSRQWEMTSRPSRVGVYTAVQCGTKLWADAETEWEDTANCCSTPDVDSRTDMRSRSRKLSRSHRLRCLDTARRCRRQSWLSENADLTFYLNYEWFTRNRG